MTFINAFKHAVIGYAIRRKIWPSGAIRLDNNKLIWTGTNVAVGEECRIRGQGCDSLDLSDEDLQADDWELY